MKKFCYPLLIVPFIFLACTSPSSEQSASTDIQYAKGQSAVQGDDSEMNLLNIALGSKDHSTLVAASQAAEIEDILVNVGPITLFAPTNAAFEKIDKATLDNLLKPENQGDLRNILYYHAAPGKYNLDDLKNEISLYEANGGFVDIKTEGDDVFVNGSKIIASIEASNGYVHVIEDVLLPK